jgi:4-hydroxybenzoate polyprenyltransferase
MKEKKWTEFLGEEFFYGGHWFSIGVSALIFSIMILLHTQIRWELLLIVYLLIQCLFNYNHYKEFQIDASSRSDRIHHLKIYYKILPIITAFYGIGFLILILYFGNIESLIIAVASLLIGLLFTKFFKKCTKKIVGFKTFYASFTLSLLIVLTVTYCSYSINLLLLELFVFFSLRFMISSSFSDIKDIDIDKKLNLLTLPVYFGKQKFLTFLHILNFITFISLFVIVLQITPYFSLFPIFSYLYSFFYIEKAKNPKTDIQSLTNIVVDGEFLFWPFFLVIGLILQNLLCGV